jgi:hypothetical protein
VPTLIAAALLGLAAWSAYSVAATDSAVSMHFDGATKTMHGKVTSKDSSCEGGRFVQVGQLNALPGGKTKSLGGTKTNAQGEWKMPFRFDLRQAAVQAFVNSEGQCGGAKSGVIHFP